MSAMSDYLETQLRNHIFRTSSFSKPPTLAIALCTAATTDADTGATAGEVSNANAYARQALNPSDSNWTNLDSTGGVVRNAVDITFPTATGSWGTITHVRLVDSSTYGSGNVLVHGALTSSKSVSSGDVFRFPTGNFSVTFA